ncbi:MAG: hypothetical protein CME62_09405 [Halobacteriovoraceae bacterium]|nr:hypothetical protein [Halobacteriovoraceae bacterium]|tara:strand:- start:19030 stop:19839 length:810 start_codon:yes stop_codon:yes gene_type:complete
MFSLLTLLDDIAMTLDDVAVMTKVAVKRTSALMADDLAVNAGVVVGVTPDRELPIVKSIFFGSLLNKVYSIAGVLILTAAYPPLLTAILLLGGLYLSYEGAHKIEEKLFKKKLETKAKLKAIPEKEKIKGAVKTDLILSIEIIVIAKSTLTGPFLNQLITLIVVGLAASILIYGLVAVVVKVDDFGLHLVNKGRERIGMVFVNSMPFIMKSLGIIGTLAMILVGGGIVAHTFHFPSYINEHIQNLIIGLVTGAIVVALFKLKTWILPKK